MIVFLTPVVAAFTSKYKHFDMIKYGGYFSAISPFFLAFSSSIWTVCCFIILLSLGERFYLFIFNYFIIFYLLI
jgi:hypothetical protein